MSGFLFAMLAVILASLGARDQITMADQAQCRGEHWSLLAVGIAVSIVSAAAAGWAAMAIAPLLTFKARLIFCAMAMFLAALESSFILPSRKPKEPTQSLGALALVLLAQQATDAARFLIVAMAVVTAAPVSAAAGGAAGAVIGLFCAWSAPELFDRARTRIVRRSVGIVLGIGALGCVARATGWL